MTSKPAPIRGSSGCRWIVASLCALPALSAFSPAASADTISVDALASLESQVAVQINRTGRTFYIGQVQAPLSEMRDVGHVTVSRVGDLAGYPVSLVRKVKSRRLSASSGDGLKGGSLNLRFPVSSARLTSIFGSRRDPFGGGIRGHSGIDLAASFGTPVFASGGGFVSRARWQGGYGLLVSLEHGAGIQTRYGHLSQLTVQEGQRVNKGDLIGYVGSTGRSTGPHLHYEVRENGMAVNPLQVTNR